MVVLVALLALGLEADRHLRAAGALLRFGDVSEATGVTAWVAGYRVTPFDVEQGHVAGRVTWT